MEVGIRPDLILDNITMFLCGNVPQGKNSP
jgi:hypothetical protein